MDVALFLVSQASVDRIVTRLVKDGYKLEPTLSSGKYGHQLTASYLLTFKTEPAKAPKKTDKSPEESDLVEALLKELDVPYFGGTVKDSKGTTTYLTGHLPKVTQKPKKPKNPLDNVLPFPKSPPQPEDP